MPELRTDWLTGRTVLIAENRANRPNEYDCASRPSGEAASAAGQSGAAARTCPFCPGNESETPAAHYEQYDDQKRWRVRIIPNKYPVLTDSGATCGSPVGPTSTSAAEPAAAAFPAFGVHEVIVETPRHVDRTSSLSEVELRHVLEAYAARMRHWSSDDRLAYGLVFKNQGARAGASLAHLHGQLIALPEVPAAVQAELRRANKSHAEHRSCVYCRLIQQERSAAVRVVYDRDGYFAFCPFASLQPCEVWLMPVHHEPWFEQAMLDESLARLAKVLRGLVVGIESLVPSVSFNLLLRTAPWHADAGGSFHWRIELQPRMNAIAGLEAATGIYVNSVAPERAAERLRFA